MNEIFRNNPKKFILVFFDEILIYSHSMTKHLGNLQIMFELLKLHQLVANGSKCVFGNHQVEYLGHVISQEEVSTNSKKI